MSDCLLLENADGRISVSAAVLSAVVKHAAEGVEGVRVRKPRRGLDVDVDGSRARVAVDLAVRYGLVLPGAASEVQDRVAAALARMCGLEVDAVDVSVEELED